MEQTQNGATPMDSLEIIEHGKQLQAMATVAGMKCPQYTTAFGLRTASKLVYLAQNGPRLTPEMKRQYEQDLETIKMIAEGDRAELYGKLITALEKATDKLCALEGESNTHGEPILMDEDVEQNKWNRNLLFHARKCDPVRIS